MIIHNDGGETKQSTIYSWATGSVTAAGVLAATDLEGVTGFTGIFTPFDNARPKRRPHKIKVEADGAAYIKLNGGNVITIGATSPFEAEDLIIESIGVSTGGAGVTITVYLQ